MSRTAAKVTQADVARAIRAAKQAGAGYVEIMRDGCIRICLSPPSTGSGQSFDAAHLDDDDEVVL